VVNGAQLEEKQMAVSRDVLRRFGNMSSATIMFVLREIMNDQNSNGAGCAMAFGPGLTVESMCFEVQKG
jgi:predicted naringenin-chalcone synthase